MSDETCLNELLDRWEELCGRGASPTVERVCVGRPELADELRWRIAALADLDSMLSNGDGSTTSHTHVAEGGGPSPPAVVPALSPYLDLRFHARGGLGDVFWARDAGLNREVALKVIQAQRAGSPGGCRRFEWEAEVTGRLEHPGVAPVYAAGRCEDGRPYYVMRFVRGETLGDAIRRFHEAETAVLDPGERSLAFRGLLNRLVQVCNTIDFAHGRRVLHRDIKPSNVMLGPHGETLVVDWGLAKVVGEPGGDGEPGGSPDPRDPALTAAGSALGTPAFMAPEQVDGDPGSMGPRTDVYGLGTTLYCLLTGRAPFEGEDLAAVHNLVLRGEFRKPRQVNREVFPALEAICLKAMSLSPEGRYGSAKLLAEDLERWLADEPVSAWREPAGARARRWMRRHRVWVLASAAMLVTVSLGLGVSMAALGAKNIMLERERRRADANGRFLLQGLTESLKRLANPALAKDPECRESTIAALKEGEAIYLDLIDSERRLGSPSSRLSGYWIHVALLRTARGDREGTIEAYHRALDESMVEVRSHPDDPKGLMSVAGVRTHLGLDLWVRGERREARDQLRLAAEEFRRAMHGAPDDGDIQRTAAWLHLFCPDPQIRDNRLALDLSQRFVKQASSEGRDRPRFSEGIRPLFTLGLAQYRTGDWQAARSTIEESLRRKVAKQGGISLERYVETGAVIDAYDWFVWSMALARLGEATSARQRFEEAARWMRRNRYGDFELHLLHDEAASLLGLSSRDMASDRNDAPGTLDR